MRKLYTLALLGALLGTTAAAQQPQPQTQSQPPRQAQQQAPAQPQDDGHEYAPLQERELDYEDWTLKTFPAGEPVNLREWARGKRLVLVAYFAPWCANWRMERPVLARLHEKYRPHGFDVIAVSNYATAGELKNHFDTRPAAYTVVVESDSREEPDLPLPKRTSRRYGSARLTVFEGAA